MSKELFNNIYGTTIKHPQEINKINNTTKEDKLLEDHLSAATIRTTSKENLLLFTRPHGDTSLYMSPTGYELFCKLVSRALSTWTQADPELKELGDLITHGAVQQDYQSQA